MFLQHGQSENQIGYVDQSYICIYVPPPSIMKGSGKVRKIFAPCGEFDCVMIKGIPMDCCPFAKFIPRFDCQG